MANLWGNSEEAIARLLQSTFGDVWLNKGPKPNRTLFESPSLAVRVGFAGTPLGANWLTLEVSTFALDRGHRSRSLTDHELSTFLQLAIGSRDVSWSTPSTGLIRVNGPNLYACRDRDPDGGVSALTITNESCE